MIAQYRKKMTLASMTALLFGAGIGTTVAAEDIYMRADGDQSIVLSNLPDNDDFELLLAAPKAAAAPAVAAEAAAPDARSQSLAAHARQYRQLVEQAAKGAQVEARLLHAVIAVESGYNPQAVSPKGAIGLMQVMPETGRRYGIRELRDPIQNLQAGAHYLGDLLRLFKNDLKLALAAYNAGENAVLRYGGKIPPYRETTDYVPKVLAAYRRLEGLSI